MLGVELEQGLLSSQRPLSSSPILVECVVQDFLLLGGCVGHEVYHPIAIAIAVFVVTPGNINKVSNSKACPSDTLPSTRPHL